MQGINRVKRDAFVPESKVIMHTDTMAKKNLGGKVARTSNAAQSKNDKTSSVFHSPACSFLKPFDNYFKQTLGPIIFSVCFHRQIQERHLMPEFCQQLIFCKFIYFVNL